MKFRFLFISGGIFSIYCLYSVLQEKLLKGVFGEDEERFTFVMPLLFVATLFNYLYAHFLRTLNHVNADDHIPTLYNCCISLTYLLAMVTSFMALQWVSYPAQVIAKSGKPIPVLVMGVLIGNKSFPVRKYFIVFLIVFGVALFLYKDNKAAKSAIGFGIGEILLGSSLLMDGLTNSLQERVMAQYKPKSENLMLGINKWALLFVGVIIIYTGEAVQCLAFLQRHPSAILQVFTIATCGAAGQYFIFMCLTEYGTLTCSIITTTRKFFSVFGSVILFGHVLKVRQWLAVACVFTGLFLDIYFGKPKKTGDK
uniref:Putative udp-gal transporter n=3 Tax=Rhodnius TaxID=13248 RepID=R4G4R0_RHOPR